MDADRGPGPLLRAARSGRADAAGLLRFSTRASWHLATAVLTVPPLAELGGSIGFASRDREQDAVAELLGFAPV